MIADMKGVLSGTLDFHGQRVRSVMLDGEPWFSAPDVCAALEIADPTQAAQRLDPGQRRVLRKGDETVKNTESSSLFVGSASRHTLINRAGVTRLIMRSNKPSAMAFQTWLAEVVIPSIQDHGGYIVGQEALPEDAAAEIVHKAAQEVSLRREQWDIVSSWKPSSAPLIARQRQQAGAAYRARKRGAGSFGDRGL